MKSRVRFSEQYNQLSPKEEQLVNRAADLVKKFVELSPKISNKPYRTRNAHAKSYGDVHGILKINDIADENFKKIFPLKEYTAVVRLSNAALQISEGKDSLPAYGFAIKLLKFKEDKEFNLPMVNFPLFTNSVENFLKLFIAINRYKISSSKMGLLGAFHVPNIIFKMAALFPEVFKNSIPRNAFRTFLNRKKIPLAFTFHSVGCYRMGDFIVKFKLEPPREKSLSKKLKNRSQKKAVEEILSETRLVYSLKMQYCRDEKQVNDLSIMWPSKKYTEIGKLIIEPKSFLNSAKTEVLSFNPFENPADLKPVGRIQKIREKIYKVSVNTRRIKI